MGRGAVTNNLRDEEQESNENLENEINYRDDYSNLNGGFKVKRTLYLDTEKEEKENGNIY